VAAAGVAGRSLGRAARWELRSIVGTSPWLTERVVRGSGERVTGETRIVIEGFPRTGNTFAVVAFTRAQPSTVSVAHHVHLPSMVLRAAQRGIPCVLLVREPRDAVLSLVVRLPDLSVRQAVRSYLRFYEPLLPVRARVVVASFEQVTCDFGIVIDRVNAHYGTTFARFEHTQENVEAAFEEVDRWDRGAFAGDQGGLERSRARPTPERERLKAALSSQYEEDRLWGLRLRADEVYAAFEESSRSPS
jgi:hypothetical protein